MEKYKKIERSIITTYRKSIWRKFIRGINIYNMINEGDKIAVCVSGGKASMLMAKCMQEIQRHGVIKFDMEYIVAEVGDISGERQKIIDSAGLLNIPIRVFECHTDDGHSERLIDDRKIHYLYTCAEKLGCNKIALGHHFDDVIETILTGILYGACVHTIMPKLHSAVHTGMEIIRPIYMVKEKDITAWEKHNELAFAKNNSLLKDETAEAEGREVKALIKQFRKTSPYIDMNIFNSVRDVNLTTVIGYYNSDKSYNFLDDYDERG